MTKRAIDCRKLPVRSNLKPGQRPNITPRAIALYFSDQLRERFYQTKTEQSK